MIQNRGFQVRSAWGPEPILRIDWDNSTIVPNIAEGWEYSDDGKTFTLRLREGMKWSDGVPFSTENFEFWWNNVVLNETLSPSPPSEMVINGKLPTFTKIDDYTVSWTFAATHANLPLLLAHAFGSAGITRWLPSHYLQQFHSDFVDEDELAQLVADNGFETWDQLINNRSAFTYGMPFQHVEMPTLLPYKLSQPLEGNILVADRNPYYWKVDPEGQQLPYINRVIVTNYESAEIRDAAIVAGEMNWVNTDTTFTNFPLYQENAEAGNYEVRLWKTSRGAEHTFMLNHTAKDPVLREIFSDIRFKRALSLAMDRQTISNVVFLGLGVPAQVQPIPGSKFRVEEYVTKDTEFDPDTANALLDEMGLTERDGSGIRLRPDGESLVMRMDVTVDDPGALAVAQLYQEFFREVGLNLDVRGVARDQTRTLIDNNDIEVGIWIADKCSDAMFPHSPEWHVPYAPTGWNQWGPQWTVWYATGGERGEEPPEDVKQVQALFDQMKVTVDEEERIAIGKEILRLNIENLWNIGNVGEVPIPVILGTNFKNYPEDGFTSFDWLGNHQYHIEQTYFEGGEWVGAPA
jgi:peptide/nickel transport system substrate-binding protein